MHCCCQPGMHMHALSWREGSTEAGVKELLGCSSVYVWLRGVDHRVRRRLAACCGAGASAPASGSAPPLFLPTPADFTSPIPLLGAGKRATDGSCRWMPSVGHEIAFHFYHLRYCGRALRHRGASFALSSGTAVGARWSAVQARDSRRPRSVLGVRPSAASSVYIGLLFSW